MRGVENFSLNIELNLIAYFFILVNAKQISPRIFSWFVSSPIVTLVRLIYHLHKSERRTVLISFNYLHWLDTSLDHLYLGELTSYNTNTEPIRHQHFKTIRLKLSWHKTTLISVSTNSNLFEYFWSNASRGSLDIVIGRQPRGAGGGGGHPPNHNKTCLLESKIDEEAEIFMISSPPLGYHIIKPL